MVPPRLTSGVLEEVDSRGLETDASQKPAARLLVDLPSVPHADSDAVALPNVSAEEGERMVSCMVEKGEEEENGELVVREEKKVVSK